MVRIKRSVHSKKSKKKVLKNAKGYTGARSKRLRAAKEQVMHAGADAFTHRKDKKADFRKLESLLMKKEKYQKIYLMM